MHAPPQGYFVKDGFLGAEQAAAMRAEAVSLHSAGEMRPGQSTRWNAATCAVETYDKAQVLTTQVLGGENYLKSPRLVEYIVAVTKVKMRLCPETLLSLARARSLDL